MTDTAPGDSPQPAPPAATLREPAHRVSARARLMWRVATALQAVVVLAVATVAGSFVIGFHWWMVAADVVVVVAYAGAVPEWRWAVHRWEATATAVYTQTGWWARERRIAPMSRLQTVDYVETPLSRLFGLATVTVTTASAAGALRIEALDRAVAQRLTDDLTRQADSVLGDAT